MISSGPYTREARSFEKAEEYEPDTLERIRKTYTPRVDGDYVEWEIKTPAQSHLSTTIYIERTYTLHPKQLRYAKGADEKQDVLTVRDAELFQGNYGAEINQPGFALQSMMSDCHFSFDGGSVSERPSKVVPWLQQLYPDNLEPYIRGSGRAFASDARVPGMFKDTGTGTHIRMLRNRPFDGPLELTLVEPLIVSFCKPGRAALSDRGDILPNVRQFTVSMRFKDEDVRLLNLNSLLQDDRAEDRYHQVVINDVATKLHITHYRGVVPDMKTPIMDVDIRSMGIHTFHNGEPEEYETPPDVAQHFEFDFRTRPHPEYIVFWADRVWDDRRGFSDTDFSKNSLQFFGDIDSSVLQQYGKTYNTGACLVGLKLSIGTSENVLDIQGRHRLHAMTRECFPQYRAPIDARGGVVAIKFDELPWGALDNYRNSIRGVATWGFDPAKIKPENEKRTQLNNDWNEVVDEDNSPDAEGNTVYKEVDNRLGQFRASSLCNHKFELHAAFVYKNQFLDMKSNIVRHDRV